MYLRSFKAVALLLVASCLFSCPARADCSGNQGNCDRECCGHEMSCSHYDAAAAKADGLPSELLVPAAAVPAGSSAVPCAAIYTPLVIAPDINLVIENKIHPHTGPPQIYLTTLI